MDLTKQQLINVVGFLSRVQLTGNEVPAFNELTKIFQDEYAKQNAEKTDGKTEKSVPANSEPKKSK